MRDSVPKPKPGISFTSLSLSPTEGFVLTRVDGRASVQEISETTGLPLTDIDAALRKLVYQGAIEWAMVASHAAAKASDPNRGVSRAPMSGAGFHPPQRGGEEDTRSKPPATRFSQGAKSVPATPPAGMAAHAASQPQSTPQPSNPAAVKDASDSELELEPERRKKIDDMYIVLELMNHYDVLGVGRAADKAQIRTAYFELSKQYHPDTLFRKKLGSYKPKMEAIFKRLTDAYEVLSKTKARAQYDSSLPPEGPKPASPAAQHSQPNGAAATPKVSANVPSTPAAPAGPRPRGKSEHQMQAVRTELEEKKATAQRLADQVTKVRAQRSEPARRSEPVATPRAPEGGFRMSVPRDPAGALRELLGADAKRTQAPARPPSPTKAPEPPPLPVPESGHPSTRTLVLDSEPAPAARSVFPTRGSVPADPARTSRLPPALLRDLATSMKTTGNAPTEIGPRLRREAEKLIAAGNLRDARERLKAAVSMDGDPSLRALYEDVCRKDDAGRIAELEAAANRCETERQWSDAALYWIRIRNVNERDAQANAKAARNLLRAEGDLRLVYKYAQAALEVDPNLASARKTLAVFYVRSKMVERARAELERARALLPNDESIQQMLDELPRS